MKTPKQLSRNVKMYLISGLTFLMVVFGQNLLNAQSLEQYLKLQQIAVSETDKFDRLKADATKLADALNLPVRIELKNGKIAELMRFELERPVYYITNNLGGAKTISTNKVWPQGSAGLSLSGSGEIIGIWDGGGVRLTHQEFSVAGGGSRIIQKDNPASIDDHPTHVSGNMIATGLDTNARGMANQALVNAYEWNNDVAEMALEASAGLRVSNHSYGIIAGWVWGNWAPGNPEWHWMGNPAISQNEDYRFGFYDNDARSWDEIAENAPEYLIVKAAGNDRSEQNANPNHGHWVWDNGAWTWRTTPRPPDGGANGYDCIPTIGIAKNILTVGAVEGIPAGYQQPSDVVMSTFSGWGPADDGRIKPDLVAKGVGVYSSLAYDPNTGNPDNDSYDSWDGTSMAAPMVSGSVALLNQHYKNTHNNANLRSATMKALLIHTADEAGNDEGPDYCYGWGLMNTANAAQLITDDAANPGMIMRELSLKNNEIMDFRIWPDSTGKIRLTMAWTDPAGTPTAISLDPQTLMLVNDLDVRIIEETSGAVYAPYVLNPQSPASAATEGDNFRDNVEQIYIANVPSIDCGRYFIRITHKNQLQNSKQDFSLIVTGIRSNYLYVKKEAAGSNDGSSWDNAFVDLQDAIDVAVAGNEIWVAKGIYYPTGNGGGRHRHFSLKNCVEIYGGFAGDENPNTFPKIHRNLLDNETFLDGQNDRYHVVRSHDAIDNTAIIDGFTIRGGKADCMWPDPCNSAEDERGAAMFNKGDPTIRNCTFTRNYAMTYGAGMYNYYCSPVLIHCTFNANDLPECGGGITNWASNPLIINCMIHGNKANTGGGICNEEGSQPVIINTTIASNFGTTKGGGIMNDYWSGSAAKIRNGIIWGNAVDMYPYCEGHQIFNGDGNGPIDIFATCIETGLNHIAGVSPTLIHPGSISVNPEFATPVPAFLAPTHRGNYRLQYTSPAIDTGNNIFVPSYLLLDIDWNFRIDRYAHKVDMGAYEWPKECLPPKNLAARQITENSAELAWTPGGSETSWDVEYGPKGFTQGTGTMISGLTVTFYLLTGLTADTEYDFYARGHCPPSSVSEWAGPKIFKTLRSCDPPTALTAATTSTEVTLTWTEPVPPPQQGYEVRITDSQGNIVFNVMVAPGTNALSAGGLIPGSAYIAEIRSDCGRGEFSKRETIAFQTSLPNCDPPLLPTVFPSDTDAIFFWTDPIILPVQGYQVEVVDLAGVIVFSSSYPLGVNTIQISPLNPLTDYVAGIRSDCGNGNYSSWEYVTFTTLPSVCDAPTGFTAFAAAATVDLNWTEPVPPPQQGYIIEVIDANGVTIYSGTVMQGVTALTIAGLTPATLYFAQIISDCGNGNFSTPLWLSFYTCTQFTVTAPADISVCIDDLPFVLTGATPAGGVYSGNGVLMGSFDPLTAGAGAHVITYTYTDIYGCNGSDTFIIKVNDLPVVGCPPNMTTCVDVNVIVLAGGTPTGGTYTGPGVVMGNFMPPLAGAGAHVINYTITDPVNGCANSCDFTILVNPLPNVTCPPDMIVCIDDLPFVLGGGNPQPGIYTGAGVAGGVFSPATAGVGTHLITYTFTDPLSLCTAECIFNIIVRPLPVVTCPSNISVFLYTPPFPLTGGTPGGGIYTDAMGTLINFFDPFSSGIGNHKITYTYTDNHGCSSSCEFMISVFNYCDYGDAPDGPYPTLLSNNGARHKTDGLLFLGNMADGEPDGQPTLGADGDDFNLLDDEDGVTFVTSLISGQVATVEVAASWYGKLNAWVDFNQANGWADAGEHIFVNISVSPGMNTLNFLVPSITIPGEAYARFRVNYNGNISFDDYGYEGEVEDYRLKVLPPNWSMTVTNRSHLIYVPASLGTSTLKMSDALLFPGDFIGVFFDDPEQGEICGGAAFFDGISDKELYAYGDDLLTFQKDGFDTGEAFKFKIYRPATGEEYEVSAQFNPDLPNSDGRFYDNGLSGLTGLNIVAPQFVFTIPQGWSGISTYYEPLNPLPEVMFAQVLDKLQIVYNEEGMFWPGQSINTLGTWNVYCGYIAKATENVEFMVEGNEIIDKTLWLKQGWNLIPVLDDDLMDIYTLFQGVDGMILVKEIAGSGVYWPQYGINTIGNLQPGAAYYVMMASPGMINFDGTTPAMKTQVNNSFEEIITPWNRVTHTPVSHLAAFNLASNGFLAGDIIGSFTSAGYCAGVSEIEDPELPFAISIYGDDRYTSNKEGFEDGECLNFSLYRPSANEIFDLKVTYNMDLNAGYFEKNGLSEVIQVMISPAVLSGKMSDYLNIYPNPTNGELFIDGSSGRMLITIMNASGMKVYCGEMELPAKVDLSDKPKGAYLIITENDNGVSVEKLIIK